MDPLTQQLMQRAMPGAQQGAPAMPDLASLLQPPTGATAPLPTMPGVNGQPPPPQSPSPPPGPMMGTPPPGGAPGGAPQVGGNGVPVTPPNPHTHIPSQNQRFDNAQQLMESYRNGWSPNPMLLRASQTQG